MKQKAADRAGFGQKIAWSMGSVADQIMSNGINMLALPLYNLTLGVDPRLLGFALAIPRFIDAITDPLMGNISDNFRSKWGRRKPFILLGGLGCAVSFFFLWSPPTALGETGLFAYFMGIAIVYYLAYTVFAVPRNALGYELSGDYKDRNTLYAINAIVASATGMLLPWLYKLSFNPMFAGAERNELVGVRWVALICAVLVALSILPSVLFNREAKKGLHQDKIHFLKAAKITLTTSPFLIVVVITFVVLLSVMLVGPMAIYINTYYLCDGDKEMGAYWGGIVGTVQALTGLLSAPLIAMLAKKFGKMRVLVGGLLVGIAGFVSTWWTYNPAYPWLQVFSMILIQPGIGCVWVLNGSMIADVCDYDELHTGLRREGMFGAVFTFLTKLGGSSVTLVGGYLLVFAGYVDGESVTPETIFNLRAYFAFLPAVLIALCLFAAAHYPLTESKMIEIKKQLKRREVVGE
ncbi:MAG: MFS transporter [Kiritimatiellales bacterium]|nr:MFS transporter [Kiritimatiellales bacterium]MCF7863767.1 MFS transporter [Kiritimatiellales bacterium]